MNLFFRHKKPRLNRGLKALLLISGAFMFAFGMFGPIYAIFVEEIGGGITVASNAWAVFLAVAGALTFVAGKVESKFKETELAIMWSQYVIGIAYIIYYFTDTVTMLYLAQVFLGIGDAIFWPAFHALYGKHVDGHKSTEQWALYDGLAYVVPAVAAALGGWLVKWYGFDMIFLIMAILSFANGVFILFLPRKVL